MADTLIKRRLAGLTRPLPSESREQPVCARERCRIALLLASAALLGLLGLSAAA